LLEKGPLAGPLFENYVIAELKKTLLHTARDAHLFYFRDNSGLEIDLIIEDVISKTKIFAEIKNTSTPKPIMIEKINKIVALDNKTLKNSMYKNKAVLVYRGKEECDFNAVKCVHYLKFLENPM
jgi:predicted AAA+ superfamily ATPase